MKKSLAISKGKARKLVERSRPRLKGLRNVLRKEWKSLRNKLRKPMGNWTKIKMEKSVSKNLNKDSRIRSLEMKRIWMKNHSMSMLMSSTTNTLNQTKMENHSLKMISSTFSNKKMTNLFTRR